MRVLVAGAGATGGYFGGRLAEAGRHVTFLVRPRRAEELAAKGLSIISPKGDISLTPKVVTKDAIGAPYDVIILGVKAYSLDAVLKDLTPAIGPDTMILPLLNGMKHMDTIAAAFGPSALIGGLCSIAVTVDGEGRIVHMSPFHNMAYGELSGASTERIQKLDAVMQNAGFDARLSAAIEQEMWEKWTMLATLAGVTCLMRGSIGDIVGAPRGLDFVNRFLDEVVAIAAANGHAPRETQLKATRALLTAEGSTLAASMFRDLQKNAPVEAGEIIGDLLARGEHANVPAPLLAATYTHLSVYDCHRRTSS